MNRTVSALLAIAFTLLGLLYIVLALGTRKPLDWLSSALFLATAYVTWFRRPVVEARSNPAEAATARQRHLRTVFFWAGGSLLLSFLASASV